MGAKDVYVACTHAVLSGPAFERIADPAIKELIVTNTIPISEDKITDKIKVLSVATLLQKQSREFTKVYLLASYLIKNYLAEHNTK